MLIKDKGEFKFGLGIFEEFKWFQGEEESRQENRTWEYIIMEIFELRTVDPMVSLY